MADEWLIFVDTNIFLDFYRTSGESAARQMKALERHKERLILTDQVRMEFLKNRQKVIQAAFKEVKPPLKTNVSQIVADSEPARLLKKAEKEARKRYNQLEQRYENILSKPSNYDEVFKSLNRIFKSASEYNLRRPNPIRFSLRSKARKRFMLGYPPRKKDDTSYGDALNWEWIIHCAQSSQPNQHVLIVSRDGDFGSSFNGTDLLNDWLHREFKDRVTALRKIELTTRLTTALKRLDEVVQEDDVEEEKQVIASSSRTLSVEERSAQQKEVAELLNKFLVEKGRGGLPGLEN